jgi:hypothetical protein
MKTDVSFETFISGLQGLRVNNLWRGFGSAVFLELGRLSERTKRNGSPGQPVGEVTIGIEWSWRIEGENSIICGSWSDEELWEPTFDRLRNTNVSQIKLFGTLPEVAIFTSSSLCFVSFSTTEGQPAWSFVDRRADNVCSYSVKDGKIQSMIG